MLDDEVRYAADHSSYDIELDSRVILIKNRKDYLALDEHYPIRVILFTVKWDSTSKLARRTFHRLPSRWTESIAMIDIDCFDWTDLCHEQNIIQWPTLLIINKDKQTNLYHGSTDEDEMALFIFR
jgi:hypothetical protein